MSTEHLSGRQHIRAAEPADIAICALMLREWLESAQDMAIGQVIDTSANREAELGRVLSDPDSRIFVAEDEDGVQGFISGRVNDGPRADFLSRTGMLIRRLTGNSSRGQRRTTPVGVLDHVVVRPGKRSNYMSLALFKALSEWFRERGISAIEATVWTANTRVLRISERVGFKPVRVLVRKELE